MWTGASNPSVGESEVMTELDWAHSYSLSFPHAAFKELLENLSLRVNTNHYIKKF